MEEANFLQANNSSALATAEMEDKIALFGKLPDECLTCLKPYDKMDKDRISQEVADQKKKIDSLYGRDRL